MNIKNNRRGFEKPLKILNFSYTDFPSKCSHQNNITGCGCDHLVLSEPPYDSGPNIKHYCGSNVVYKSKTRSVQIKFIHWNNISHAFTLEYASERENLNIKNFNLSSL